MLQQLLLFRPIPVLRKERLHILVDSDMVVRIPLLENESILCAEGRIVMPAVGEDEFRVGGNGRVGGGVLGEDEVVGAVGPL